MHDNHWGPYRLGSQAGILAIVIILVGGLADEKNQKMLKEASAGLFLAALLIGFAGMFFGYGVARLGRQIRRLRALGGLRKLSTQSSAT